MVEAALFPASVALSACVRAWESPRARAMPCPLDAPAPFEPPFPPKSGRDTAGESAGADPAAAWLCKEVVEIRSSAGGDQVGRPAKSFLGFARISGSIGCHSRVNLPAKNAERKVPPSAQSSRFIRANWDEDSSSTSNGKDAKMSYPRGPSAHRQRSPIASSDRLKLARLFTQRTQLANGSRRCLLGGAKSSQLPIR